MTTATQLIDEMVRHQGDVLRSMRGISEGSEKADVRAAIKDMASLSSMTPFSKWYKGDHGKARTKLTKSLRALLKSMKSSGADKGDIEDTKEYLDSVLMKNTSRPPKFLKEGISEEPRIGIDQVRDIAGDYNGKFLRKKGRHYTFVFKSYVAADDFVETVGNSVPVVTHDDKLVTVEID